MKSIEEYDNIIKRCRMLECRVNILYKVIKQKESEENELRQTQAEKPRE